VSHTAPASVAMPAASSAGHALEVAIEDDRWSEHPFAAEAAESAIAAMLASGASGIKRFGAATVLLDNDAHVAALNMDFRGKPQATNVLSFPSGALSGTGAAVPGDPTYAGDVIIARETVEREASEMGIPVIHHLQHLVIHGLLHLVGYDHLTDRDAAVMEALETRILATLGVADPYAD
jgi:probable rRNA maturation factor